MLLYIFIQSSCLLYYLHAQKVSISQCGSKTKQQKQNKKLLVLFLFITATDLTLLLADKIKRCAALFELRCLRLLISAPTFEFALIALIGVGVFDVDTSIAGTTLDVVEVNVLVVMQEESLDKVFVVASGGVVEGEKVEQERVVAVIVDDDGKRSDGDGVALLSQFIYLGLQEAVAGCNGSFVSNVGQL